MVVLHTPVVLVLSQSPATTQAHVCNLRCITAFYGSMRVLFADGAPWVWNQGNAEDPLLTMFAAALVLYLSSD